MELTIVFLQAKRLPRVGVARPLLVNAFGVPQLPSHIDSDTSRDAPHLVVFDVIDLPTDELAVSVEVVLAQTTDAVLIRGVFITDNF